jgi:hypothetical protein
MTGLRDEKFALKRTYDDMNGLVEGIEQQFQYTLKNHENDFLNAYRGHMSKVT